MQVSIVNLRKEKRLDPEYYFTNHTPQKGTQLSKLSKIRVGKTPMQIESGDTPFYRVQNIKKFQIVGKIKTVQKSALSSIFLANKNDILLTIKGRIGDAAQVPKSGYYNQDLVCIKSEIIDHSVLTYILNTKFVNQQIKKLSTGQMHPQIKVADVRKLIIPNLSTGKTKLIKEDMNKLLALNNSLQKIENEISNIFRKKSQVKTLKIVNIATIFKAKRLDPEHFVQSQTDTFTLSDLDNIKVNIGKYKKTFYASGVEYLRAKNIHNSTQPKLYVKAAAEECTREGEILITRVGNIKSLYIKDERLVPSDNFIRVRFNDQRISPSILSEYINSQQGQAYLKTLLQGSKQQRLNKSTILRMQIPFLSHTQTKILQSKITERNKIIRKVKEVLSSLAQPMYVQPDPPIAPSLD